MAQNEVGNPLGLVDKRKAVRNGSTTAPVTAAANFVDVAGLRTRLFAVNPTSYSQVRLEKMTKNDMVYALRVADEAASI